MPGTTTSVASVSESLQSKEMEDEYPGARLRPVFRALGHFVTRWPVLLIIVSTAIACICAVKLITTPHVTDLNGFSSADSISRFEHLAYQEFFNRYGVGVSAYAFITAKDNGTMMRIPQLRAAVEVLDLITSNKFTIFDSSLNASQTFPEFCDGMCQINEPVRHFFNGFQVVSRNEMANGTGGGPQDRVSLIYPISQLFGRNMSVQPNFFGVRLVNDSKVHKKTNIESVQLVLFHFRAGHKAGWSENAAREWELALVDYFKNEFNSNDINVYIASKQYVGDELIRYTIHVATFVAIGIGAMSIWLLATTVVRCLYGHKLSVAKLFVIFAACLIPLLSFATAIGFTLVIGYQHSPLLKLQIFLALMIGLYNIFHTLHIFICKEEKYAERHDVGRTIATLFAIVGPTHFATAFANIAAFALLAAVSVPATRMFAVSSIATIFISLMHEIFLFGPILALVAKCETVPPAAIIKKPIDVEKPGYEIHAFPSRFPPPSPYARKMSRHIETFVKLIAESVALVVVLIAIWVLYMTVSVLGITKQVINVTPPNLFMSDSLLNKIDPLRYDYIMPSFTAAQVFVHNARNLSDTARLQKLEEMVKEFESLPGAWGRTSSNYFLPDFLSFRRLLMEETGEEVEEPIGYSDDDLTSFLDWPEYKYWKGFTRIDVDETSGKKKLDGFFFNTIFHDPKLRQWTTHIDFVNQWRQLAEKYRDDFNATIYDEDSLLFDTVLVLPAIIWQSAIFFAVCASVTVAIVSLNVFAAFGTGFCVLSALVGLFGISSWWSLPLDILVAFNFTIAGAIVVNFTMQGFIYFTFAVRDSTPASLVEQLHSVFSQKIFPILQVGTAVVIFLLCLIPAVVHLSLVLMKLYFLCTVISSLHILLVIPVAITVVERLGYWSDKRRLSIASNATRQSESTASPEEMKQ